MSLSLRPLLRPSLQTILFLACTASLARSAFAEELSSKLRQSVFQIGVTMQDADFKQPWQTQAVVNVWGSGFYIGRGMIMTNAHVVYGARYITVRRDGEPRAVSAKIRFVAHGCDLAVLEVEDPSYLKDSVPLHLGEVPKLHSSVVVMGYPFGDDALSITKGVTSRIQYESYTSEEEHLLVQIDATINEGNSGGPVFQGEQVVGVAAMSSSRGDNLYYMIPTPILRHFLKDIEDGTYDGFIDSGLKVDSLSLTNPSTRSYHQLLPEESGTKVMHVAWYSPFAGKLYPGDLLLALDGQKIGEDGLVAYEGERVHVKALLDLKHHGEIAQFSILREGERKTIPIVMKNNPAHTTVSPLYVKQPKYLMWGGLVFMQLSRNYLQTLGKRWAGEGNVARYVFFYHSFLPEFQKQPEIVLLVNCLPSSIQLDPEMRLPKVVKSINGILVKDIKHASALIHNSVSDALLFHFFGEEAPLVVSKAEMDQETPEIAKRYGITHTEMLEDLPSEETIISTKTGGKP